MDASAADVVSPDCIAGIAFPCPSCSLLSWCFPFASTLGAPQASPRSSRMRVRASASTIRVVHTVLAALLHALLAALLHALFHAVLAA